MVYVLDRVLQGTQMREGKLRGLRIVETRMAVVVRQVRIATTAHVRLEQGKLARCLFKLLHRLRLLVGHMLRWKLFRLLVVEPWRQRPCLNDIL